VFRSLRLAGEIGILRNIRRQLGMLALSVTVASDSAIGATAGRRTR